MRRSLSTPHNQASRDRADSRRGETKEERDLHVQLGREVLVTFLYASQNNLRDDGYNDNNWYFLWIHNLWGTFISSISPESL